MSNNQMFVDRVSDTPNRRKIKIISQTADEIIADIEMADNATVEGTPITASKMNEWDEIISTAKTKSDTAYTNANDSKTDSSTALLNSTTALNQANFALQKSEEAKTKANEALSQVVEKQGTKVYVNDECVSMFNSDIKADKIYVDNIKNNLENSINAKADNNNVSQTILASKVEAETGIFTNIDSNISSLNNNILNINTTLTNRSIRHYTKQTTSFSEYNSDRFTATWQIVEIPIQSSTEGSSNQYSFYFMWYSRQQLANGHKEYKITLPISFTSNTFFSPSITLEAKGNWERRGNGTIDLDALNELYVKTADDTGGYFTHYVKVIGVAASGK